MNNATTEVCAVCGTSGANVVSCDSGVTTAADKRKIITCANGYGGELNASNLNSGATAYVTCDTVCGSGCKYCNCANTVSGTNCTTAVSVCTTCTAWDSLTANSVTTTRGAYLTSATGNSCTDCASANCWNCSATACTNCMTGYYISGTSCIACISNCDACTSTAC